MGLRATAGTLSLALAALGLAGCCCCPIDLTDLGVNDGPAQSLGAAGYPDGTPETTARWYEWRAPALLPRRYRAGYALTPVEAQAAVNELGAYAATFSPRRLPNGNIGYRVTAECPYPLYCAHRYVGAHDRARVRPLAQRFLARAQQTGLDYYKLAELIVTFVQSIEYRIPEEQPFELLPASVVASSGAGDCDSKGLLAVLLLQECGIDAVILISRAHEHAAVGIALPVVGTTFPHEGRSYAFTEITRPGWPIGRMPPDLLSPNDWFVGPIR